MNIFTAQLSESVFGRFLQAVELTILSTLLLIRPLGRGYIQTNSIEGQLGDPVEQKILQNAVNIEDGDLEGVAYIKEAVLPSSHVGRLSGDFSWPKSEIPAQKHDNIITTSVSTAGASLSTSDSHFSVTALTPLNERQSSLTSTPAPSRNEQETDSYEGSGFQIVSTGVSTDTSHPHVHSPLNDLKQRPSRSNDSDFSSHKRNKSSVYNFEALTKRKSLFDLLARYRLSDTVSSNSRTLDNISKCEEDLELSLAELRLFYNEDVQGLRSAKDSSSKHHRRSSISLSNFPSPPSLDDYSVDSKTGSRYSEKRLILGNAEFRLVSPLWRNDKERNTESGKRESHAHSSSGSTSSTDVASFNGDEALILNTPPEMSIGSKIYTESQPVELVSVGNEKNVVAVDLELQVGGEKRNLDSSSLTIRGKTKLKPIMLPRGGKIKKDTRSTASANGTSA